MDGLFELVNPRQLNAAAMLSPTEIEKDFGVCTSLPAATRAQSLCCFLKSVQEQRMTPWHGHARQYTVLWS